MTHAALPDAPSHACTLTSCRWEAFASTLDRLDEAHWHLHSMAEQFHSAKGFRFSLNCFLRSLKEVPQIATMEGQRVDGFRNWFPERRKALESDPLLGFLFKQRDVVVHQSALWPESRTAVGITKGRGMKLGLNMPSNPRADSDEIMVQALPFLVGLRLLREDEDTLPGVERSWRLTQFPSEDVLDLGARAWGRLATVIEAIGGEIAAHPLNLTVSCVHSWANVEWKLYDRKQLRASWRSDSRRASLEKALRRGNKARSARSAQET